MLVFSVLGRFGKRFRRCTAFGACLLAVGSVTARCVVAQSPTPVGEAIAAAEADAANGGGDEAGDGEGGISDNSFLIEEAYNQEPGVVQHIFNWVRVWDDDDGRERTFDFVFTQEWPIGSQKHQFSYALPFSSVYQQDEGAAPFEGDGIGDVMLNYRYQLLGGEEEKDLAIAPRFSVILDTGNERKMLGSGTTGFQFNLPISKQFDNYAVHFNAGCTILPDAESGLGDGTVSPPTDLIGYNLGASLIHIENKKIQPLVELVANWDDEADAAGGHDRSFELLISPGVRWAPYTQGHTQVVVGAAAPVGLTRESPDVGVFFYFSVEHGFRRPCATCDCGN
jgi:hypothetical protein